LLLCPAGHDSLLLLLLPSLLLPCAPCHGVLRLLPPPLLLHHCTDQLHIALTQSVALSRRMSDTDSVGISTLTRLMLPHGSVFTLLITCSACKHKRTAKQTT
jgi:hypothetical protein